MVRPTRERGFRHRSTDIGKRGIVVECDAVRPLLDSQFRPEVIEIDGDRLSLPDGIQILQHSCSRRLISDPQYRDKRTFRIDGRPSRHDGPKGVLEALVVRGRFPNFFVRHETEERTTQ